MEQGAEFLGRDYAGKLTWKEKRFAWGVAWQSRFDKSFIQRHAEAFADYVQEADRLPAGIWRTQGSAKSGPPKTTYTPAPLINILDLAALGLTPSQVLNLPRRAATMLRYGILSLPDNGSVIQWGHPELMDKLAAKEKEAANG